MGWHAIGLTATIVVAALSSLLAPTQPRSHRRGSAIRHPGTWLLLITTAVLANQILCTAYLFAAHDGDPSFIARHLPPGWFDLPAPDSPLGRLAAAVPAPELLGVSLLRVPAVLELPFVLLAYLTVCRWAGSAVFDRARRLLPVISAAWTATFCLIEASLPNPYTAQDLVLRVLVGVAAPVAAARLAGPSRDPADGPVGLLAAIASTAALGALLLAVYDVALLYNLGHLPAALPGAAVAVALLLAARLVAARASGRGGPAVAAVHAGFGWFLVLFAAPALAVRYGLGFGARWPALAVGLLLVLVAVRRGIVEARTRTGQAPSGPALAGAIVVAAGAATAGYLLAAGYPEARLLVAATAFLAVAVGACAAADARRRSPDRPRSSAPDDAGTPSRSARPAAPPQAGSGSPTTPSTDDCSPR